MTARNFAFEPNTLQARKGDVLVLRVENVTGTGHNLTVEDPHGKEIANVDLPAHETVEVEVPLERSGTYAMHCAKPFHSTMGMRGGIEVPQPCGGTSNLSTVLRQDLRLGGPCDSPSPENVREVL
jgi:plastocyanin